MKNVTIEKARLLETLKANRETHNADFDLAWDAFKAKAEHNFKQRLDWLKTLEKGAKVDLYVHMDVPENHDEDYERAIEMLDWEVGDQVELTESEFRMYVQDNWSWKGKFSAENAYYTGSASPSSAQLLRK